MPPLQIDMCLHVEVLHTHCIDWQLVNTLLIDCWHPHHTCTHSCPLSMCSVSAPLGQIVCLRKFLSFFSSLLACLPTFSEGPSPRFRTRVFFEISWFALFRKRSSSRLPGRRKERHFLCAGLRSNFTYTKCLTFNSCSSQKTISTLLGRRVCVWNR